MSLVVSTLAACLHTDGIPEDVVAQHRNAQNLGGKVYVMDPVISDNLKKKKMEKAVKHSQ